MPMTLSDMPWNGWPGMDRLLDALGAGVGDTRVVGGAVRDTLLALPVSDIDLATRLTPDAVMERVRAAGLKAVPTGLQHGTVTAVVGGRPVEVTTLRRDVETDGRHATVAFTDDWRADASQEEIESAPTPPASVANTNPNAALRGDILIVDDNEANRALLCRRLEQQGHEISAARDGQEALALLHDRDFDVLLLDIIMPELNGYQVLQRIKADERLRHLRQHIDEQPERDRLGEAEAIHHEPLRPLDRLAVLEGPAQRRRLAPRPRQLGEPGDRQLHGRREFLRPERLHPGRPWPRLAGRARSLPGRRGSSGRRRGRGSGARSRLRWCRRTSGR